MRYPVLPAPSEASVQLSYCFVAFSPDALNIFLRELHISPDNRRQLKLAKLRIVYLVLLRFHQCDVFQQNGPAKPGNVISDFNITRRNAFDFDMRLKQFLL